MISLFPEHNFDCVHPHVFGDDAFQVFVECCFLHCVSVIGANVCKVKEVIVVQREQIEDCVSATLVQFSVLKIKLLNCEEAVFCHFCKFRR